MLDPQIPDVDCGPDAKPYAVAMASKSKPAGESKKPGRSLKEKRAAKHEKQAEQKQSRKGWEAK
jgi:hypothetical protein